MTDVTLFSWNPRRRLPLPLLRRFALGPRTNNFGDLVGPQIVVLMLERLGLTRECATSERAGTLFTVGSVLHFARDEDVVWGSGVNGKIPADKHLWADLDVRAVRGPLTRDFIESRSAIDVPEVYGDPALLLFELGFPRPQRSIDRNVTFIPNLNDPARSTGEHAVVSPRNQLDHIVRAIASSEAVVTSSLHAFLFAELLRVPVALIKPAAESPFKYLDYARGTGRDEIPMFDDFESALTHARAAERGNEDALADWSSEPLLKAFPADLFQHSRNSS